MKKVTAIVLAAAMGLSLTACGSSANQAGDNGSGGAVGTTQAALEAQMDYKYIKQYADHGMLVDLNP